MALTNSPAYPVTTKSSSQKLGSVSESLGLEYSVYNAYLDLAVIWPKAGGNGVSGYDIDKDISNRQWVMARHGDGWVQR
jgi:hypothetical protein